MPLPVRMLQVALAILFAVSGALKLLHHPLMKKDFAKFGYPYWFAVLVGVIEVSAGSLLAGGFWRSAFAVTGASILIPLVVGITYTNFTKRGVAAGIGALLLLGACIRLLVFHGKNYFEV